MIAAARLTLAPAVLDGAGAASLPPARWPRSEPLDERLLVVDAARTAIDTGRVRDLPLQLRDGDVLVVNDAATLPASFVVRLRDSQCELRLLARARDDDTWRAVLFGAGDWHVPTELRPPPPRAHPGDVLTLHGDGTALRFSAHVVDVDAQTPRLVTVRFAAKGAALWQALYALGRPVQYAHVAGDLELWHTQTPFAARPWSVEPPSAGRPLTTSLLAAVRARGVQVASLTHAAGLSSTGDAALDARLPLPERYDLPVATVQAIAAARVRGGRVVGAGTTVVRALEGNVQVHGELVPGEGVTDLRLGPHTQRRVVDAIVTGMHEPTSSHFQLLQCFAEPALLQRALAVALRAGFLEHEFGDTCLLWGTTAPRTRG